jgi:IS1 family transposase
MKKELISSLIKNNTGIRGIARSLKISPTTVMKTILEESRKTCAPKLPENGIYEVDEMQGYSKNKKNKIFAVYGIERKTSARTEIAIGKRTKHTLRKVINAILLSNPKRIYTDGHPTYLSLIPKNIHRISKHMLSKIERLHLSVRNALKRFNRRTIGFSRNIEMTIACLKLFLWN